MILNIQYRSAKLVNIKNLVIFLISAWIFSLSQITLAQSADGGYKLFELKIKNHRYEPATFEVPAGERFKVQITNEDATSEEFESKSMIIEKFIGPKKTITVILGPLKPGQYDFFGCFHPDTAKGRITAK